MKQYPCEYKDENGEYRCPYDAMYNEHCRVYCGLGVEEDEYPDEEYDEEYIPSSTNRDYSPNNPWDAPGMSVSDFI